MVSLGKSDWRIVHGMMVHFGAAGRPSAVQRVDTATAQAIAYVWGWQDAGGKLPDLRDGNKSASWEFGYFYGRKVAEMEAYLITSHGSIQSEWEGWCEQWEVSSGR